LSEETDENKKHILLYPYDLNRIKSLKKEFYMMTLQKEDG